MKRLFLFCRKIISFIVEQLKLEFLLDSARNLTLRILLKSTSEHNLRASHCHFCSPLVLKNLKHAGIIAVVYVNLPVQKFKISGLPNLVL